MYEMINSMRTRSTSPVEDSRARRSAWRMTSSPCQFHVAPSSLSLGMVFWFGALVAPLWRG